MERSVPSIRRAPGPTSSPTCATRIDSAHCWMTGHSRRRSDMERRSVRQIPDPQAWDAPYLSAAAPAGPCPRAPITQWRAEHLAPTPCAECPTSPHIPSSLPLRRGGVVDLEGQQVECARRGRATGGGLGGLDRLLRIRRQAQLTSTLGEWIDTRLLEGGTGEPARWAIIPDIPPSPSSVNQNFQKQ